MTVDGTKRDILRAQVVETLIPAYITRHIADGNGGVRTASIRRTPDDWFRRETTRFANRLGITVETWLAIEPAGVATKVRTVFCKAWFLGTAGQYPSVTNGEP